MILLHKNQLKFLTWIVTNKRHTINDEEAGIISSIIDAGTYHKYPYHTLTLNSIRREHLEDYENEILLDLLQFKYLNYGTT